jgi:anti-anti-sigma factor
MDSTFDLRVDSRNGVALIDLIGELDMSTVPALDDVLWRYQNDGVGSIILDLRQLSFVDSSGLHAFLRARSEAEENGHRLFLIGASPAVRRVFEMTETQFLLDDPQAIGLLGRFSGSDGRAPSDVVRDGPHG